MTVTKKWQKVERPKDEYSVKRGGYRYSPKSKEGRYLYETPTKWIEVYLTDA